MRKAGELFYILGDHPSAGSGQALGSTSIVTDADGTKVSEMRYRAASLWDKACPTGVLREGEVRYESGASPTDYTLRHAQGSACTGLHNTSEVIIKNTQINVLKIVLCAILIAGCATNTAVEAESLFAEMYKNCEMNTLLKISFVGKLYEGARGVDFWVEPTSNISVMFPVDNNVKLLWFDIEQSKWVEVKNNVQYFPIDGKYVVGKNDPAKEYEYKLFNIIPNLGRKAELRIVIHGHTYENEIETDKCVGAYVDFEFTP